MLCRDKSSSRNSIQMLFPCRPVCVDSHRCFLSSVTSTVCFLPNRNETRLVLEGSVTSSIPRNMVSYHTPSMFHFCLSSSFISLSLDVQHHCLERKASHAYNELRDFVVEKGGCSVVGCSLLYGLDGNRKSELCAAVCDNLGLHFYSVCCASLVESSEASTYERICQALERAESSLPCMCCLEGIDALEWPSLQATEKNRLLSLFHGHSTKIIHKPVV